MNVFQRAFHLAHFIFPNGGMCLEFGVYKGATYCYQAEWILKQYPNSSLIGFDSWYGLPEESEGVWIPDRHSQGNFSAQKDEVLKKLSAIGVNSNDSRFQFVDGFFSDTLTETIRNEINDLIFVNIDVDIHRSTIEVLNFILPLLRPGVIIYWDDWKDPIDQNLQPWGEHLAWEEWYPQQEGLQVETIEINPINQRTMIVTQVNGQCIAPPLPSMSEIRYYACELTSPSDTDYLAFQELKHRLRAIPFLMPIFRVFRKVFKEI